MTSVTAVVVAYGTCPMLRRCVDALLGSDGVDVEVVVVDNGSPPGALEPVINRPKVVVMDAGGNLGFGGGCNLGATRASGEVLVFVNPDAVVDPKALAQLSGALADERIGIASARIRLLAEPELLNSMGGAVHFLGLGWARGYRQPAASAIGSVPIAAASGAGMALRRATFDALGGFTPEYFLYHEDAELSLRCRLSGLDVVLVPEADVFHDYEFSRNSDKLYLLERNRLCLLLTCFQLRTLLLIAPAAVLYELAMVATAAAGGWLGAKLRGWAWIARHVRWLLRHRRAIGAHRTVGDRDLARVLSARFDAGQLPLPVLLRPADAALAVYWRVVSRLL